MAPDGVAPRADLAHGATRHREPDPDLGLLAARGAAHSIGSALYAYNPSWRYVDAVLRYARRLRASPSALASYYRRQVICHLARGWVWLPTGYGTSPAVHAIPLHL